MVKGHLFTELSKLDVTFCMSSSAWNFVNAFVRFWETNIIMHSDFLSSVIFLRTKWCLRPWHSYFVHVQPEISALRYLEKVTERKHISKKQANKTKPKQLKKKKTYQGKSVWKALPKFVYGFIWPEKMTCPVLREIPLAETRFSLEAMKIQWLFR